MSFSFNIRAATKDSVKAQLDDKLRDVANQQPAHEADRPAIEAAATAYVDLLADSEDHDFNLTVNGSISTGEAGVTSVSLNVSAARVARATDET